MKYYKLQYTLLVPENDIDKSNLRTQAKKELCKELRLHNENDLPEGFDCLHVELLKEGEFPELLN